MDVVVFLVEVVVGLVVSIAAMASLNGPLSSLLVELCGTRERARFWTRYTNMMLFLSPLLSVVLFANPLSALQINFMLLKGAFKSALFGLFVALVVIGFQLVRFTRNQGSESAKT
ncbi:MAG TPA: hypothetical protein VIG66_02485 [Noviherbaspirillum sp.]